MSRTALYKAVYFGTGLGVVAIAVVAILTTHAPHALLLPVLLLLLLPGRVLGYFWRDLLRGLRLLNAGDYAESRRHSELFIAEVRRRPWLKHLIWLGSGSYSRDPEALALSNLGAAEIRLGDFVSARGHLEEAIAVDPLNPLPHHNMGVLLRASDATEDAEPWFDRARQLGLGNAVSDRIVRAAQARFARTDGQGRS